MASCKGMAIVGYEMREDRKQRSLSIFGETFHHLLLLKILLKRPRNTTALASLNKAQPYSHIVKVIYIFSQKSRAAQISATESNLYRTRV